MYQKVISAISVALLSAGVAHAECSDTIPRTTQGHFTDNGDGTVTSVMTGLRWKKCSEGQTYNAAENACSGTAGTYTWQEALQRAEQVRADGYAGRNDWRVPNHKELASLTDLGCYQPAIDTAYFPGTRSNWYWSATPVIGVGTEARAMNFAVASDSNPGLDKTNSVHVRLVAGPD